MKITLVTDIIAMCLVVGAVAAYNANDMTTAQTLLTGILTYYFGRHVTNETQSKQ